MIKNKVYFFIYAIMMTITTQSQYECPVGYHCQDGSIKACVAGMYSLKGWERCCDIGASIHCGGAGHLAFNSSCRCASISCENLSPMRGGENTIVCATPPAHCQTQPCPLPHMIREPHTCNCLNIAYPCRSNEVLWGNIGGPYTCLSIRTGDSLK